MIDLSRQNALVTAGSLAVLWTGVVLLDRHPRPTPKPMTGITLYSAASEQTSSDPASTRGKETAPKATASYPELSIGISGAAKRALPNGTDFLVHFVPPGSSSFTVTFAELSRPARPKPQKLIEKPAVVVQTPPPAPVLQPVPPAPEPPPAPSAPKPTQPQTFGELDDALHASPTAEGFDLRVRNSDVVFKIVSVGRIGNRAAVKWGLVNQDSSDFFVSIVNISANGLPVHSETVGPLFARAKSTEVDLITHFAVADVAGKQVKVELVQSGGGHRHFEKELPYRF